MKFGSEKRQPEAAIETAKETATRSGKGERGRGDAATWGCGDAEMRRCGDAETGHRQVRERHGGAGSREK